jgi:hypothetical protein
MEALCETGAKCQRPRPGPTVESQLLLISRRGARRGKCGAGQAGRIRTWRRGRFTRRRRRSYRWSGVGGYRVCCLHPFGVFPSPGAREDARLGKREIGRGGSIHLGGFVLVPGGSTKRRYNIRVTVGSSLLGMARVGVECGEVSSRRQWKVPQWG